MEFDQDELLALARINMEKGQLEDALSKLKRLTGDDKSPPEALLMLGRLYAQLRMHKKAQEFFERYLALKPEAVHEKFELGMTYFDAGNVEKAITLWDRVLESQPTHPPALYFRGAGLIRTGKIPDAKHSLDILLKSAAPDNLYYGKARDLLRDIDQLASAPAVQSAAFDRPNFSKTEH